ncbi:response regulator [Sphingomonas sp. RB3P16]|uniref:response regulator n=1 Tax=Parasphingomonas frigoris TaxID=3096163 RepID=UPI002FC81AEF
MLIVDDSVTMRAMLEQVIVASSGYHVVGIAADAATALTLMKKCRPDVVTLDIRMPGIDGLEFLHGINGKSHPPIVVVSSISRAGTCETDVALEAGAVACFDKATLLAEVPRFLRTLKKAAQPKKCATKLRFCHDQTDGYIQTVAPKV